MFSCLEGLFFLHSCGANMKEGATFPSFPCLYICPALQYNKENKFRFVELLDRGTIQCPPRLEGGRN